MHVDDYVSLLPLLTVSGAIYHNLSCNRSHIIVFYLSYQNFVCVTNWKRLIIVYMNVSYHKLLTSKRH